MDKKNDEEFKQQTTKYFDLLPNHYISLFLIELNQLIMYRCVCLSLTFPLSSFPLTFRTRNFVTGYNQTSKHSIVKFDSFEFIKYYITCLINFTLEYRILYFNYGFRIFLIYDSGWKNYLDTIVPIPKKKRGKVSVITSSTYWLVAWTVLLNVSVTKWKQSIPENIDKDTSQKQNDRKNRHRCVRRALQTEKLYLKLYSYCIEHNAVTTVKMYLQSRIKHR